MIRIAFSICAAIGALAFGACEKQSANDLPARYKPGGKHVESNHETAPAHGEKEKAPEGGHKS